MNVNIASSNPHGGVWAPEMLIGEDELKDFVREAIEVNHGTGGFNYSITHLASHPEIAK
ncbi:hypothetical protein NDJ22_19915 [Vibrio alginolyticus]|uniref:hypothetical protein n=1 Tax=Vibrio alginolyticus TaxID=663 RepID=UPI002160EFDB|nr:hypothetical protein [Vibrio alginolyticus]MCS0267283.1 hypothetical protein [Vibrio alginolyticus]